MYIDNTNIFKRGDTIWQTPASLINKLPTKCEIENKKIRLLDKVDSLINDGFSYEDIIKAIEIHKQLSE